MSLIAYYKMNEGWTDAAPPAYDGIPTGATIDNVNQHIGTGCGNFDGNDFLDIGNIPALSFDYNDPFSLSLWLKTADTSGWIIGKILSGGTLRGYAMYVTASGKVDVYLVSTWGSNYIWFISTNVVNDGSWNNIILDHDGSGTVAGIDLTINNSSETKSVQADSLSASMVNSVSFQMAARNSVSFLTCKLDDVRVYDHQLSSDEKIAIWNGGAGGEVGLISGSELQGFFGLGRLGLR